MRQIPLFGLNLLFAAETGWTKPLEMKRLRGDWRVLDSPTGVAQALNQMGT
jgi:hypothetical protein